MSGRVVHCKRGPYDVYIGRPSNWGNPWKIGVDGDREEVIRLYERYILDSELIHDISCAPKPCHGDVLVRLDNE